MLKCYYHTGARTDELASCVVGDILHGTSQVILGQHKRSRTQRTPTTRYITLNDEAFDVLANGPLPRKDMTRGVSMKATAGCRWTVRSLPKRFERLKEIAADLGRPIRDQITIYDFRHLWISASASWPGTTSPRSPAWRERASP